MFEMAFIQEMGSGRLDHESGLIRDHCLRIGLPVSLYTQKRMQRRQLPLTSRSFVSGDIDCMQGAMRQLGIPVPAATYYPISLAPYLHRRVWLDILGNVRTRIDEGGRPLFVKPASRAKLFTGRVFSHRGEFYHAGGASWREPVWCSEVVSWQSEYRVYVNDAEIVSADHYEGDAGVPLDLDIVARAIADHRRSGEAPVAYGIDFGVLTSGQTALVEANDGYGLGAYQIGSAAYAGLLFARWSQLLGQMNTT